MNKTTKNQELAYCAGAMFGRLKEERRVIFALLQMKWSPEDIRSILGDNFKCPIKHIEQLAHCAESTILEELVQSFKTIHNIAIEKPEYLQSFNKGVERNMHETQCKIAARLLEKGPFYGLCFTWISELTKFPKIRLKEMQIRLLKNNLHQIHHFQ